MLFRLGRIAQAGEQNAAHKNGGADDKGLGIGHANLHAIKRREVASVELSGLIVQIEGAIPTAQ